MVSPLTLALTTLVSVPFGGDPLREQIYPALLNRDAITGAEAVAKHDDGAWARRLRLRPGTTSAKTNTN